VQYKRATEGNMKSISRIRIELHREQQCFFNSKVEPLHVSVNDGQHRKATNSSRALLML
jgi:hypothetical protein